jgi:hypothetical protein
MCTTLAGYPWSHSPGHQKMAGALFFFYCSAKENLHLYFNRSNQFLFIFYFSYLVRRRSRSEASYKEIEYINLGGLIQFVWAVLVL